ncbi:DUF1801 domain-containing protein [Leptospira sarikeiensis]|uniref:DUF1801 domain-containing protein n=1 Tax=Leptospira sarikeiensis TaxID=2484943 RepID=A0A4V3JR61_9LEPT|nr:DUF1801 domain-containing protein [Leptospira sarikeiensis]TGL58745.1 DUF1801 domain-containing protein [Leptospira sarikeiensis]
MKKEYFRKFNNSDVARLFADYPKVLQAELLNLRELIFKTAEETAGTGQLEEVLKWGQPSYITPETKSGSTIRIDALKGEKEYAIFFHCQTDLVSRFRKLFPKKFRFEGNRCIIFSKGDVLPKTELKQCISFALTYHLDKKRIR